LSSLYETGYFESSNGKLMDDLFIGEIFDALLEAQVVIDQWRKEYNALRPHSSRGYLPRAPEAELLDLGKQLHPKREIN
jgi:transposase InsO family protein